jgi:LmbE family N-acetylglucosaminyl deacetylase
MGVRLEVQWCVLGANGARRAEAEASAAAFLAGAASSHIELGHFEDSFFPYQGAEIKTWLKRLKEGFNPDVVLSHRRSDAHQDHREISQLTWNLFRDHLILEYEIPKWDGDLDRPNVFVPLTDAILEQKIELLHTHFASQRSKDWFDAETFRGLARLRGMECRSPERWAEAFVLHKARLW